MVVLPTYCRVVDFDNLDLGTQCFPTIGDLWKCRRWPVRFDSGGFTARLGHFTPQSKHADFRAACAIYEGLGKITLFLA